MKIAYASPWVPPEWIAAHGGLPVWLPCGGAGAGRGVCPLAAEFVEAAAGDRTFAAAVFATTCDQMRHAAAWLSERRGDLPVFLMNVPATWQTEAPRRLYIDELRRLGRFLSELGGRQLTTAEIAVTLLDYDDRRTALLAARSGMPARQFAEATAALRGGVTCLASTDVSTGGVPLALLGGPIARRDFGLFDLVRQAGGDVVLDGTEGGQRTMPAPLNRRLAQANPAEALALAYFDTMPDPYRRPNERLYQWLDQAVTAACVRGILFRRYVWCDLWHAELHRLKAWSPVPVLEIDVADDDASVPNRTLGRLEAFVEMLR